MYCTLLQIGVVKFLNAKPIKILMNNITDTKGSNYKIY